MTWVDAVLLSTLLALHVALGVFLNVWVFFARAKWTLIAIMLCNALILWQWHYFGHCLLTPVENRLRRLARSDTTSFTSTFVTRVVQSKALTFTLLSLLPVLSSVVAGYRLNAIACACAAGAAGAASAASAGTR